MKRLFALCMLFSLMCLSCFSAENLARLVQTVAYPPEVKLPWVPTPTHLPVVIPTAITTGLGECNSRLLEDYLFYSGDGGATFELDMNCFDYFPAARIATSGASYFTITGLDQDKNQLGVIMDVIGKYDAYIPLILWEDYYQYIVVDTDGSWTMDIYPMEDLLDLHILSQGFSYTGMGSDIVYLRGGPGTVKFSNEDRDNFSVTALTEDGFVKLVGKHTPYELVVDIYSEDYILFITSRTPWDAEYR